MGYAGGIISHGDALLAAAHIAARSQNEWAACWWMRGRAQLQVAALVIDHDFRIYEVTMYFGGVEGGASCVASTILSLGRYYVLDRTC